MVGVHLTRCVSFFFLCFGLVLFETAVYAHKDVYIKTYCHVDKKIIHLRLAAVHQNLKRI